MKIFKISIADLIFSFEFKKFNKYFFSKICKRYKKFATKGKEKLKIDVYFINDLPSFSNIELDKDLIVGDGFILENNEVFIKENLYCFENFLRVFYSYHILLNDGVLLHSAGFFKKDFSFIFIGKSGSGKTTLSKMLSKNNFNVMSDEICAIRYVNKSFYLYSTPFWGSFRNPKTINIGKKLNLIFFPFKSNSFCVKDFGKKDAIKKILRCVFNFSKDKDISSIVFNFVFDLIKSLEYKALYFPKNGKDIINYIDLLVYNKNEGTDNKGQQ